MTTRNSVLVRVDVVYIKDLSKLKEAVFRTNGWSMHVPTVTLRDLQADVWADTVFLVQGDEPVLIQTDDDCRQIREDNRLIVFRDSRARRSNSSSETSVDDHNTFHDFMREQFRLAEEHTNKALLQRVEAEHERRQARQRGWCLPWPRVWWHHLKED